MFATTSCPTRRTLTGMSAYRCWLIGSPVAASSPPPTSRRRRCTRARRRRSSFAAKRRRGSGARSRRSKSGRSGSCTATTSSADGAACGRRGSRSRRTRSTERIEFYKTSVLPSLEDLEGFCSASLLIDRSSGRAVSSTTFDSRDAMERNQEQARELRNTRTRELGADVLDVGEFELAIAHLRVPEMA